MAEGRRVGRGRNDRDRLENPDRPGNSNRPENSKRTRFRRSNERRNREEDRAVAPVVGKALEAGIVVLYISLLGAVLYGGLVPDYRTAAGAEVGERVLSQSAQRVQQAVPAATGRVAARTEVSLPATIRGRGYEVRVEGRTLVLDHPRDGVGGRTRLALPETVDSVEGEWSSRDPAFVAVRGDAEGLAVVLESGEPT
ncbi:hypothetical protein NGM10_05645 [Halorussus salilacus]|uniref:DUF7266 family protein n=1 Tax=Halorussus salilacus TaxID=2953750 RepID=UPI00209F638D|nr:hypothetical protein [Halorussus salilacus]USZ69223.1 hypothetical protein NGM10_05645 [Halorussus salilacus]